MRTYECLSCGYLNRVHEQDGYQTLRDVADEIAEEVGAVEGTTKVRLDKTQARALLMDVQPDGGLLLIFPRRGKCECGEGDCNECGR